MIQYGLLLGCGLVTGILSGLFGIGGGVILVPLLMLLLRYPQVTANGTSLVALLGPVGLFGVLTYYRAGKIAQAHLLAGALVAVGILVGTAFGARVAITLPPEVLRKAFSLSLALLAVRLWFVA